MQISLFHIVWPKSRDFEPTPFCPLAWLSIAAFQHDVPEYMAGLRIGVGLFRRKGATDEVAGRRLVSGASLLMPGHLSVHPIQLWGRNWGNSSYQGTLP
jgi:hypothetical protein